MAKKEIDKTLIDLHKEKQIKTLENLIDFNLSRLENAKKIEEEKSFVFPETTAICKIIMTAQENINVLLGISIKDNKKKNDNVGDLVIEEIDL